jgi:hypothetical protein
VKVSEKMWMGLQTSSQISCSRAIVKTSPFKQNDFTKEKGKKEKHCVELVLMYQNGHG